MDLLPVPLPLPDGKDIFPGMQIAQMNNRHSRHFRRAEELLRKQRRVEKVKSGAQIQVLHLPRIYNSEISDQGMHRAPLGLDDDDRL